MAQQLTDAQHSKLVEAAQKTDHTHELISGIRTQLIGHTDELRAGWGGASGMAFGDQHSGAFGAWNRELGIVLDELQRLASKLRAVEAKYRQNEDERRQVAQQLAGNIEGASRLSASING